MSLRILGCIIVVLLGVQAFPQLPRQRESSGKLIKLTFENDIRMINGRSCVAKNFSILKFH